MTYTTHGLMTPADMADYRDLYDLDAWRDEINPDCPGHNAEAGYPTDWCARDETCPDDGGEA